MYTADLIRVRNTPVKPPYRTIHRNTNVGGTPIVIRVTMMSYCLAPGSDEERARATDEGKSLLDGSSFRSEQMLSYAALVVSLSSLSSSSSSSSLLPRIFRYYTQR